jgi:myo-inositol 2-dehydrogenase/D-chiro-inositol 1-dehydrogenase
MALRVGIVGMGKMGFLHASLLSTLPEVEVRAVCESQFSIRRFGAKMLPGIRFVRTIAELRGEGLDAVYITTPPRSHAALVRTVLEERVAAHVFVEKPLASSAPEGKEILRLARAHRGASMVGYQKRFAVTFRKARDLLHDGAIGEIRSADAYAYSSDFAYAGLDHPQARARGGALRDIGCHAVDLLLWFFGEIVAVSSPGPSAAQDAGVIKAGLTTSSGVPCTLSVSAAMPDYRLPEIGVRVTGSHGQLSVNEDRVELAPREGECVLWHRHRLHDHVPFLLADPEYHREDEFFIAAIRDGSHATPDFEDGARVDAVLDRIEDVIPQTV